MTAKHTPGPLAYEIVPSDAVEAALPQAEWTGLYIGPADEEGRILHTIFEGGFTHGADDGDPEADAKLWAAAPETAAERDRLRETVDQLADALEASVRAMSNACEWGTHSQYVFNQLKAEIDNGITALRAAGRFGEKDNG